MTGATVFENNGCYIRNKIILLGCKRARKNKTQAYEKTDLIQ